MNCPSNKNPLEDNSAKNLETSLRNRLAQLIKQVPEDRLLKILERFYARLSTDILVGFFFKNRDTLEIAKKQMLFMFRAAGLTHPDPEMESIKSPARAHDQLPPILEGHFDRRIFLLKEQLALEFQAQPDLFLSPEHSSSPDHSLSRDKQYLTVNQAIDTWVNFESAFRKQIIESRK